MNFSITHFQRKPQRFHYSIESIFNGVRLNISVNVKIRVAICKYESTGFFKRFFNVIEAVFNQSDINHITGDVHYLAIGLKKKRTILTIHDCGFMNHHSKLARLILKLFWLKLPVLCSQVVTVISQATKEEVIKFTGCKESKVRIIPDFILSQFHPVPKQFNMEQPTILQVGTKPNKNISRLAEALKGIPCKLSIIGRPSETDLQMLDLCNINYIWQANLSNSEVMQKYVESDMLVFVSTIEGFGMPIIEANTVERPVVTGNISSMPEVAGDAACLVDPYSVTSIREGILKVIKNSVYREQLIINGRKNRERYNPIAIADSYYQLYCEIYRGYNSKS